MTVAIVGLGLIGGSVALAIRGFENARLIGVDRDPDTLALARERNVVDLATDDPTAIGEADLICLCLSPRGILRFLEQYGSLVKPGAVVTDVGGVKTVIGAGRQFLPAGVDFVPGHPMAGKETSGLPNAEAALFQGAHYLLTPDESVRPESVDLLRRAAAHMGFRDVVITTPERHDQIIAYTSQLMHILAVAVCDDEELYRCRGFEGGSFRGCTRVAALDVPLWTELFSMNTEALCQSIRNLEANLKSYREVLESRDEVALAQKLAGSAARKRGMDLE